MSGTLALQGQLPRCSTSNRTHESFLNAALRLKTGTSPRRATLISRAEFRPSQTDPRRNLPAAPPARAPPPPPPPPPPPSEQTLSINISRRALAAIMFGGTAAWYSLIKAGVPIAGVDRKRGLALLKTKKGNVVAATQDEAGRVFLFDKAGNIYYDTEDPAIGMYIVDTRGEMYNEFVDKEGTVQQVYVGNIGDLQSVKVTEIGGVSVEELQKSVKGFRGGRVVGFPKLPDANGPSWENLMPPNAPAQVPNGGGRVKPPPFLEDLEIELEPKKGGLFGGDVPRSIDPVETIKSLRREGE